MNEIEAVDVSSLPNSIDFTSLKRFHKSLAPEVLLPYCKVIFYLVGCAAYRQYMCLCLIYVRILNYFYLYSRVSM